MSYSPEDEDAHDTVGASDLLPEMPSENLRARAEDPFFANVSSYLGEAPSDLSINHDEYLYGDLA
jgi:hypothetical protein